MMGKWDSRFIALAEHVAQWSKDPSTKVGAVITKNKQVIAIGYNGFPQGVEDSPARLNDRDAKYKLTVHAEPNAILMAQKYGNVSDTTIYIWPLPPCCQCAGAIIQSGIKRVICPKPSEDHIKRWGHEFTIVETMFKEAGVEYLCSYHYSE